jgi:maltooligosyltrehalose trehalohydrolase
VDAGLRYGFRLDGNDQLWPDPASRWQPDGPLGLSQLVDPLAYRWEDEAWPGIKPEGQVIYEMHIGTFTQEGTWKAALAQLPELARLGITVLEVMPVADFPGDFGWGYDGVCLFAPTRLYGEPDHFRRFVNVAHREGLGVILDVVYNHFGTVAHTIPQFSEYFRSQRYKNDWGDAINFDGERSAGVREFFSTNVRYWIEEFHLDGLRFDATQTIEDASEKHILTEMAEIARRAAVGRRVYLVAENERQDVRIVSPREKAGHGLDAVWNDDFHHTSMVRLTGRNEAYYSDYLGDAAELLAAFTDGFIYQGQLSQWQKAPRGTPTRGLAPTAFVTFIQNHDQVANSMLGERIDRLSSPGCLRAMTAFWLLAPQTPMFFQGQEFWSSSPFLYFADNREEQARIVAEGRAQFLKQFPSLASPQAQGQLANPADRSTFERCKLNWAERQTHNHAYALHVDLLRLRREDPVLRLQRTDQLRTAALGRDALIVRFFGNDPGDRLLLVNFGRDLNLTPVAQPLFAPPVGCSWKIIWSSCDPRYDGGGTTPPLELAQGWHLPGEAAVVLGAVKRADSGAALPHEDPSS